MNVRMTKENIDKIASEIITPKISDVKEIDLLTELETINESKFRFQNQKVMLTYKTHLNKDDFTAFLRGLVPDLKKIYIAHENGEGDSITPYEHTHSVIDFGKNFQSKNVRIFDFIGIHPNISKITSPRSWKKACKYICKEDKTVVLAEDDNFGFSIAESIWEHSNVQDALRTAQNLRDVMPIIALMGMKKLEWGREIECSIQDIDGMYPWQRKIWDFIAHKPNDRTVYWIGDEGGCKGKTQFIKYCDINCDGKVLWIIPSGSTRDIIHVVMEQINSGWRGDTIMINLSRSATCGSDMSHVYRVIEDLKDGMIFSSKYNGGKLLIPNVHVIVMSNTYPQLERLTGDRWKVGKIDVSTLDLIQVTTEEIKKANAAIAEKKLEPVTLNIGAQELGKYKPCK